MAGAIDFSVDLIFGGLNEVRSWVLLTTVFSIKWFNWTRACPRRIIKTMVDKNANFGNLMKSAQFGHWKSIYNRGQSVGNNLDVRPGFVFKGRRYFSDKSSAVGIHRKKPPGETLAEIKKLLKLAGVTRLADITGLDNIGIPVTLSIRPTSRTIAVSSGKGVDIITAMVSGAMESLELHHAEYAQLQQINCPYAELKQSNLCIEIEHLPLREGGIFNEHWPETWTLGWDIIGQRSVAVPMQAALMAPNLSGVRFPSIAAFVTDSNGLASGNDVVEAILSGLLEAIERDAIAIHKLRSEASGELLGKIDLSTIPYESFQRIRSLIESSGTELVLYDCTSDIRVPTYRATILRDRRGIGQIVEGFGTHLSNEVAILRAVTEACQGRAVVIAGARDDVFQFALERVSKADYHQLILKTLRQHHEAFQPSPERPPQHLDQDLLTVIGLLADANVREVIVVELKLYDCEQSFVKVIVPKLEGYPGSGYKARGRALSIISKLENKNTHNAMGDFLHHAQAGGNQR